MSRVRVSTVTLAVWSFWVSGGRRVWGLGANPTKDYPLSCTQVLTMK